MDDKGRLEHIKLLNQLFIKHEKAEEHQRADEYLLGLWQEHGCWIIEQLGRVQELEEQKLALIEEMGQVDERFLESEHQNKRYRATINAMGQILKDAIHSLDVGEKIQGLEYGVAMRDKALEGEE